MARHCSSVTVFGIGAIDTAVSAFSVDIAGDIGGPGDADSACTTGVAGGAGGAGGASGAVVVVVVVVVIVDVTAVSSGFAASVVSGATSVATIAATVFDPCFSLLLRPSAIAVRDAARIGGNHSPDKIGEQTAALAVILDAASGTPGTPGRQIREPKALVQNRRYGNHARLGTRTPVSMAGRRHQVDSHLMINH